MSIRSLVQRKLYRRILEAAAFFRELHFLDREGSAITLKDESVAARELVRPWRQSQQFFRTHNFQLERWPELFILDGLANHHVDLGPFLKNLRGRMKRGDRAVLIFYNPYLMELARNLGLKGSFTFITGNDLADVLKLGHFELVRKTKIRLFGIVLFWLCHLRSVKAAKVGPEGSSLSVIIPAKNERENIKRFFKEFPPAPKKISEIIFIEGHSQDNTYEEIVTLVRQYQGEYPRGIQIIKQQGKGKAQAVREGIDKSTGDLIVILDADLTIRPKYLERILAAYEENLADFINGSRLVYPIEGNEMKYLNKIGNIFFSKILSFVLGIPFSDTLCGTKLFSSADYDRFRAWKLVFGGNDPFGDFDLLFPCAQINLGALNLPLHYYERTYGKTNIHRFSDGWRLFLLTYRAYIRIYRGKGGATFRKD